MMSRFFLFLFIMLMLIAKMVVYDPSMYRVFAVSPSFPRQEIVDPVNDWLPVNRTDIGSFFNKTEFEEMKEKCKLQQYRDSKMKHFHPPDIEAVTYLSDGRTLNATIWLSSGFIDPPNNASSWLLNNSKDAPWEVIRYGMTIAVHSVYDTEGSDYSVSYRWDAYNNSWTRSVRELSPIIEIRFLDTNHNYTAFQTENQSHVDLSLDLSKLNYPDEYALIFYAYDVFKNNSIKDNRCILSDITQRVYVPAPRFDISTSPSSVEIRPGEQKDTKLQLKSNANIKSEVFFSINKTNDFEDGLIINFSTDKISVPFYGIVTSTLDIKATENVKPGSYMLPIFALIDIPTEAKPRRSIVTGESLSNTISHQLTRSANLTITVLPSLTILDYFYDVLNKWGSPIKNLVELVIAIGGAIGIGSIAKWTISKRRKTKNKMKNQK